MKKIFRLFRFAGPWAKHLVAATLALFVISAVNLAAPEIIRRVIVVMEGGNLDAAIIENADERFQLALRYCRAVAVRLDIHLVAPTIFIEEFKLPAQRLFC